MARLNLPDLSDVDLCNSGVITNIGYIHDKGHPEPWFIAMDAVSSKNHGVVRCRTGKC
jgi:hypothetical protein